MSHEQQTAADGWAPQPHVRAQLDADDLHDGEEARDEEARANEVLPGAAELLIVLPGEARVVGYEERRREDSAQHGEGMLQAEDQGGPQGQGFVLPEEEGRAQLLLAERVERGRAEPRPIVLANEPSTGAGDAFAHVETSEIFGLVGSHVLALHVVCGHPDRSAVWACPSACLFAMQ